MCPHDVFISHDAKDRAVAEAACEALERAGHLCWVAPRDAAAGRAGGAAGVEAIGRVQDLPADPLGRKRRIGAGPARGRARRRGRARHRPLPDRGRRSRPTALDFLIAGADGSTRCSRRSAPHLDHLTAIVGRLLDGGEGAPLRPLTMPPRPLPPAAPAVALLAADRARRAGRPGRHRHRRRDDRALMSEARTGPRSAPPSTKCTR